MGCGHQLLLGSELQLSTTVKLPISGWPTPLCCRQNQALHSLCRSPSQLQGVQQPQMPCSLSQVLQASSPAAHSFFGCAPMPAVSCLILPEYTDFYSGTLLQIMRGMKALVHTMAGSIYQDMRRSRGPADTDCYRDLTHKNTQDLASLSCSRQHPGIEKLRDSHELTGNVKKGREESNLPLQLVYTSLNPRSSR